METLFKSETATARLHVLSSESLALDFKAVCERRGRGASIISTDDTAVAVYGITTMNAFEVHEFALERGVERHYRVATAADLSQGSALQGEVLAFLFYMNDDEALPTVTEDAYWKLDSVAALRRFLAENNYDLAPANGEYLTDANSRTLKALAQKWNAQPGQRPIDVEDIRTTPDGVTAFSLLTNIPHVPLSAVLNRDLVTV